MLCKLCPRCKAVIGAGKQYCDKCQVVVDKQRAMKNRNYNKTREKKSLVIYNSREWKILRQVVMAKAGYICEECGKAIAEDVHHVIPITADWERRLDYNNLKALCVRCHNRKHKRF